MKRIGLLLLALAILLCSCGEKIPPANSTESTETTATNITETTGNKKLPSETTESSVEVTPPKFTMVGPYRTTEEMRAAHPFESFYKSSNYGLYIGKIVDVGQDIRTYRRWRCAIRVRVVGMSAEPYPGVGTDDWSVYYVQITAVYGAEPDERFVAGDEIYTMSYLGSWEESLYGRPMLEIGKEYLRLNTINLGTPTLMMPIMERNGVEYVYGYGIEMGGLNCAIPITDEEENQIYKLGLHDDEIAFLIREGQALPTFDYKCELYAFLEEFCGHK